MRPRSGKKHNPFLPPHTMHDLNALKAKHDAGELEEIKQQLKQFICANRADFFRFREREIRSWRKEIDLFICLKLFILEKKTIDFRSEMQSQIAEIEREVQRRLQTDACANPQAIKQEWTKRNAASWRAHRIMELIFVLNADRELFLNLVSAAPGPACSECA
ncbi:MAG: hypothetical protein V1913_02990 [Fibrobacterota bacterium]